MGRVLVVDMKLGYVTGRSTVCFQLEATLEKIK